MNQQKISKLGGGREDWQTEEEEEEKGDWTILHKKGGKGTTINGEKPKTQPNTREKIKSEYTKCS